MIQSAEAKVLAVQVLNKMLEEPIAGITIEDLRVDSNGNVQYKTNDTWVTIDITSPTISTINCHGTDYAIKDNISHYLDMNGLQIYDKKIKEYIDKRIDEKLSKMADSKYKVMMGESD